MLPDPTRNDSRYLSPVETLTSCMLWLSVGVNQRKFGGAAELAAVIKLPVETDESVNVFVLENGKWSSPLGQPDSQYACQVRPADERLVTNCGLPLSELNE